MILTFIFHFWQAGQPEEEVSALGADDGAEADDSIEEQRRIPNEADFMLAYSSAPRKIHFSTLLLNQCNSIVIVID